MTAQGQNQASQKIKEIRWDAKNIRSLLSGSKVVIVFPTFQKVSP